MRPEAGADLTTWIAYIADADSDEEGARRLMEATGVGATAWRLARELKRQETIRTDCKHGRLRDLQLQERV